MLIIFDEFSKFLEYVGNENMMKDLKIIQDFAELASRTGKKEQIIFSCITHKTINEYIKKTESNDEGIERELNLIETEDIELVQKEIYYLNKILKNENLSSLVSDICEEIYNQTPVINNEMINKNEVSTPIYKARNTVIDTILNDDKTLIKSEISAEATIYKAIVDKKDNKDIRNVLNIIKEFIQKAEGKEKTSIEELCQKLQDKPYGIRKGVLPVLLAIAINEYSENIVLYFKSKEIEMQSNNISKMIEEPDKYLIHVEKGTTQKNNFVSNLFKVFEIKETENYRNNIKILTGGMKKWVLSLPKITREVSNTNSIIFNKSYIEVKNELLKPDMNNNEFLFEKIENSFQTENYETLTNCVYTFKNVYDNYLDEYIKQLVFEFKKMFNHNTKSNLNLILTDWDKGIDNKVKETVVRVEIKDLFNYIDNLNTYNDKEIIENISNILLGMDIEEWQENTHNEFFDKVKNILEEVKRLENEDFDKQEMIFISDGKDEIKRYVNTSEISLLGNTLKNNIEESLEEYGESVSESEKIKVLLQIIKKYM